MWDDFISRQIRRTNRNLFLTGASILVFLGVLLAAGWRDTYNFVFGPFPVQSSELVSITNPDVPKRFFLKVQGEEYIATGMQEVDASNHDKVRAEIIALVVNKRLLLVKTPADNHQLQFTGTLTAVPAEVLHGAVRQWDEEHPDLKGAFLPFMLDATGFRKGDNLFLAIAGACFGVLGLVLIGIPLRRQLQPERHPLLTQLPKYGGLQDVRMRIDSEVRSEGGGREEGFGSEAPGVLAAAHALGACWFQQRARGALAERKAEILSTHRTAPREPGGGEKLAPLMY